MNWYKSTWFLSFSSAVAAGIVVWVVTDRVSTDRGRELGYAECWQVVEGAPKKYVEELEKLLLHAVERKEISDARALVSARNDLRGSLESIGSSLNSEFDRLVAEVEALETARKNHADYAASFRKGDKESDELNKLARLAEQGEARVHETIETLHKKWPSKKEQIAVEVRKVLSELGIARIPRANGLTHIALDSETEEALRSLGYLD